MAPIVKTQKNIEEASPSIAPVDLEWIPVADALFKVSDCECEFDFIELHPWLKQNYINQGDQIRF